MRKPVRVTAENETGRNLRFVDPSRHRSMSRREFVQAIELGKYPGYHIRKIHGLNTPASNPDGKEVNNLG